MDFKEQLKIQIGFIARSCSLYDQGYTDEAKRIAVAIRVILHDTNNSTSLLKYLGIKETTKLLSTMAAVPKNDTKSGVICIHVPLWFSANGIKPPLGDANRKDYVVVKDWWDEIVISQNTQSARKDIVLGAANQDGGAHVDNDLREEIKELKKGVGFLTTKIGYTTINKELTDHHLPILRQIGYEVLNSPDLISSI